MHLQKLFSSGEINDTIEHIAKDIINVWITKYCTYKMNLIYVLDGSVTFKTELIKKLNKLCYRYKIDKFDIIQFPLRMKTYEGTEHKHNYEIVDMDSAMRATFDFNEPFLIVDDILDTGYTINTIINHLVVKLKTNTNNIITNDKIVVATLVEKPIGRANKTNATFISGFKTDKFVVGYGMDLNSRYRNINAILELHNYDDNKRIKCYSCGDILTILDHTVKESIELCNTYPDAELSLTNEYYKKNNEDKPICNKCWGIMLERAYSAYDISFH